MDKWRAMRALALLGTGALLLSACGGGDGGNGGDGGEAKTDIGVTSEACPNAVNSDNGCIYLGILSDLSEGPFAALAVPITEGQRAFWKRVNEAGGIGGYDVDIDTYTRDTKYDAQLHSAAYREIEPKVLALASTLGTATTQAILEDMDADDMIGAPASWWSGWSFEDKDKGLILESGYSYCLESMVGLDWFATSNGAPAKVIAVGYPGDYGGDSAAGVKAWAEARGVAFGGAVETAPNAVVGTQDAAVKQVVSSGATVAFLAVGPAETAEIVGKAMVGGFKGRFLGAVPTWNPALLGTAAAPALLAAYTHVAPWENFEGSSEAHKAMQASLNGQLPKNDGYTFGWIWSYPIKAALEAAADKGDLTRAGVRSVVEGLEVDYEGALPTVTLGGDPNENAVRKAVINKPNTDAGLGIKAIAIGVTGETSGGYDYTAACSG